MPRDPNAPGPSTPVFLSSRDRPRGSSMIEGIESHWRAIRGARRLPVRTDLDPAVLDAALPWSFVIERVAPEIARFRVAGQKLCDLLGMEARGMPLCGFFSPEARATLGPLMARVFDAPAIVEMPVSLPRRTLRAPMTGRMILLPLDDGTGAATRAFGAILCDGAPGRSPLRFVIPDGHIRCEVLDSPAPALRLAASGRPALSASRRGAPALRLAVDNG